MKITQIETIRVKSQPHNIWVHIHTDSGIVGLGETFYAPSVVAAAIHDFFGPLLIGRDPFEIERHWEAMFRLSDHAGYGGAEMRAISALDIALCAIGCAFTVTSGDDVCVIEEIAGEWHYIRRNLANALINASMFS